MKEIFFQLSESDIVTVEDGFLFWLETLTSTALGKRKALIEVTDFFAWLETDDDVGVNEEPLERAAEEDVRAQLRLGRALGGTTEAGLRWLERAPEQGDANAQCECGDALKNRLDTTPARDQEAIDCDHEFYDLPLPMRGGSRALESPARY